MITATIIVAWFLLAKLAEIYLEENVSSMQSLNFWARATAQLWVLPLVLAMLVAALSYALFHMLIRLSPRVAFHVLNGRRTKVEGVAIVLRMHCSGSEISHGARKRLRYAMGWLKKHSLECREPFEYWEAIRLNDDESYPGFDVKFHYHPAGLNEILTVSVSNNERKSEAFGVFHEEDAKRLAKTMIYNRILETL